MEPLWARSPCSPRPQLVCAGAADPLTPDEALQPALETLRAAYGAGSRLRVLVEPGVGHRVTPAMREAVTVFLQAAL